MPPSVKLSVTIGEDGTAHDIRVLRPLGLGLDEAAIAAVSTWRFLPGTKDSQPVAVKTEIECNFALEKGRSDWSLARAQYTTSDGATQPSLLVAPYSQSGGPPQYVTARVGFDVSPQGVPVNIQIEDSSDPNWNDDVINLIREWRFLAALRNGTAVQSHVVFDLTRGLAPQRQDQGELRVEMRPQPPQKKQ